MKIIPLSEGSFTVDASKNFIPFKKTDELQERNRSSLLVEIQPFVIVTDKDIILLDTGLGLVDESSGQFQLYRNLKENGIYPDDVTKVILSHLHKDHIGGLLNPFTKQLGFEQADYFVQEKEMEYAYEKGAPSYETESLEVLKNSDRLHLLEADTGVVDGYIHYEVTGAHSKFHQVIWIKENGETVFFGADDAPQLGQMKRRFAAKYDYDGKKAAALREKWWQQGTQEGWTFIFYHDVKHPVYHQ